MPTKLKLTAVLFWCVIVTASTQNKFTDSLKILIANTDDLARKATLNGDLAVHFYDNQIDHDSAYFYNEIAYTLAKNNFAKREEARALFNFGLIYTRLNAYDKAIDFYEKSFQIYDVIGKPQELSAVQSSIGAMHFRKEEYYIAIEYFNKAIAYSQSANDIASIGVDYINLGETEYKIGHYERSLKHLNVGQAFLEKAGYNISASHIYKGNTLFSLKQFDAAQVEADLGYTLAQEEQNIEYISQAALLQHQLSLRNENYKEAMSYYQTHIVTKDSLNAAKELNNIEKLRLNFNLNRKEKELEFMQQQSKYLLAIYVLLGIAVLLLVWLVFRQIMSTRMTKSIHEVQRKLVLHELEKRVPKSEEPTP